MESIKKFNFLFFLISLCFFILFASCGKEDSPTEPKNNANTVTDIDGNVYQTVKVGNQWWMAENLKVTKYRNGDAIPNVTASTEWENLSTGAYCDYNNNTSNVITYGRIYNWYAVNDSRNIAPEGWHVPTDEEWKELEMYLGMSQAEADTIGWRGTEGGKLKEASMAYWKSPNEGATNQVGFSALPSGHRFPNGSFLEIGESAAFWSSSESPTYAWDRFLYYDRSQIYRGNNNQKRGHSVRLVQD